MKEQPVDRVVIGMDPHKRSVTIEVMRPDESVGVGGRFDTDPAGYATMLEVARAWPERVWAVEGCNGIGRHVALRLLADGEQVIDVPPRLSARVRMFATGQGRKTDATDAHSIALVGVRMAGLRPVVDNEQLAVLRVLVDRRRALGEDHTRMVSQLHHPSAGADSGRREAGPVGGAGEEAAREGAPAGRRWQGPSSGRGRAGQRSRADLCAEEGGEQGALAAARRDRHDLDRLERHRALRRRRGCWSRSGTSPASRTTTTSRPGPAPSRSTPRPGITCATGCPGAGTVRSTGSCTSWPPCSCATPPKGGPFRPHQGPGKTSNEAMRLLKRRVSDIVFRTMLADAAGT